MKNMHRFLAGAILAASFAGSAAAQADEGYFTVDESSVKIEEIAGAAARPMPAAAAEGKGIVENIGNIVNLMEKIFGVITQNQPVVDIAVKYANAVPFGATHWTQLQGWNKPSVKKYSFTVNNSYGAQVVKADYQVHWVHGGNYQGKGKFLTGVTIEPVSVRTSWGYKVSLTAEVPDSTVVNVGTQEDPVAAMQVQLRWTVHSAGKDMQQKAIYYVQGDGYLQEIGTPFENAAAARRAAILENIKAVRFN